mmetsp:Transcript_9464/g.13418  ORF Transcript_9464/g.13418 Transcript_9464/m.13418 type:complete len:384 (-) Transcript_9464:342-1493(-)|eukprot:CAMPEP_0184867292 /NCGR_PEP_ID=MMETSP0580-20130426/25863_1 /TAXON_ID=1118495 /ORGANISM="Dactyliosolen fragilissimus" /LENGTH=383 /DNA_ID=CAMNT_0027367481 /DNA_START=170 /DNA_END=1321 /DNA_ORIENTATION=-
MSKICKQLFLAALLSLVFVSLTKAQQDNTSQAKPEEKVEFPEEEWGTYYDPKGIFCGKYDCYKILGFDYESWGRQPPTRKELTQSYRNMSKKWHPDKNKKDKGAKDRFVKINKAYEILTDPKQREEYDMMRERPDEYLKKYGSNVFYHYAPQTNTFAVVFILVAMSCVFTWFVQKQRWQNIANRVIRDAVEGLSAFEGGSAESIEIREKAEQMLKEKKENEKGETVVSDVKSKKKLKLTKKEIRDMEKDELRPFIVDLVNEIDDFGAGFHKPTWRDLLIFKMCKWPFIIVKGIMWETKYYFRRLTKKELNDEEREVLTRRAVGNITWEASSPDKRDEMIQRELWVMSNLEDWQELVEVRQLSSGDQKRYNRMKKKEKKSKKDE